MRKCGINLLLIAALSIASVVLYEVLWCLVDLDVRRDFLAYGISLEEFWFDMRLCSVFTLLSLGYSYLIAYFLKRFVTSVPLRWGLFSLMILVANTATAAASTEVLDWWLEYVSNDEIRAENFFVFGLVVSFTTSTFVFVTLGKATIKAEQKRRKAEISTLKAQVKPHFLMNTIEMLSDMALHDPKAASSGLKRLSLTYRYILDSSNHDMAAIVDELDFLSNYIELINKRAGNSVFVSINPSVEESDVWLLPMSLQLLVENALKHNSRSLEHPLKVNIRKDGDKIVVSNNLQPLESPRTTGTGLENLRSRLYAVTKEQMIVEKTDTEFVVKIPVLMPKFKNESIDYRG